MTRCMLLAVAGVAAVIGLAASGGAESAATTANGGTSVIDASTTTATGSSVLIAMGHLHDPSNTFWEVFLRPVGSASWALHTPPGVASNGGLVVAASPSGSLTVGFLISADLKFSPVAQSQDGGAHWSPGELPSPLASTPDALAVGSTGKALALVATADQRVLQTSGDLSSWKMLTSARLLRTAAPSCGVRAVAAVAYNAATQPLLGVDCAHAGAVGVLEGVSSGSGPPVWHDIGPPLGTVRGAATVTRLVSTADGTALLALVQRGKRLSVVGVWGSGSSPQWSGTTSLSVPAGWSIKATATGGGSGEGLAVLFGSGDSRRVGVVAGPGTSWTTLPPAPQGASGVSFVGTEIDTFVVSGSHLAVWAWTQGASGWSRTASITVPVPYGSSS